MLRDLVRQLVIAATMIASVAAPALAHESGIVRDDHGAIARQLKMPVYEWHKNGGRAKGIVLAIHGLTMHGTVYDAWARDLAAHQMIVAAPDLRGYGQWYASGELKSVNYKESEEDLAKLAQSLRSRHRGLPLFVAGESLGGALAVRLAAHHPELVDGLILSAPAIKHKHAVPLSTVADGLKVFANPAHKVDLSGYIKHYFSESEVISEEEISDPLIRKSLNLGEIMSSCRVMASSAACISEIPADMPVLMLQGKKDRMVKLSSVGMLEENLKTKKQTTCWFPQRGHILLETAHVAPETTNAIDSWLTQNCSMRTVEGASVASIGDQEQLIAIDERQMVN